MNMASKVLELEGWTLFILALRPMRNSLSTILMDHWVVYVCTRFIIVYVGRPSFQSSTEMSFSLLSSCFCWGILYILWLWNCLSSLIKNIQKQHFTVLYSLNIKHFASLRSQKLKPTLSTVCKNINRNNATVHFKKWWNYCLFINKGTLIQNQITSSLAVGSTNDSSSCHF